ncbi:MAG TPA: O-antigen ligase family protein [Solirubrobacteraceae bacterium]|nr:O-antigen ligase family protein [Solirubrobacteraceae bacterium]
MPQLRAALVLVLVATLAATLVGYRPSLSPLGLHPRGTELGAAKAEVLVDTANSELADSGRATAYNSYLAAQVALRYALYLQGDEVTASLGRDLGLHNQSVAASGPYTLLLNRTNLARKQRSPVNLHRVNHDYRLLLDLDGQNPTLTLYAQAPTALDAITLVDSARGLLTRHVSSQQASYPPGAPDAVVLRPLGPTVGGSVAPDAHWQLMGFVFALVLLLGGSLFFAYRQRLRARSRGTQLVVEQLDRLDDELVGADCWPHTKRVLPWSLAGFMVILFLVPFDAIALPVQLPVNSTLDRPIVVALAMLWFASLAVVSGAARPRIKLGRVHFAVLAFLAVCFLSVALNGHALANMDEITLTIKKLALLISYIVFFFIVASVLRPREVPRFVALMVGLGVIVAVGTIIEFRFHYNPFYSLWGKLVPVTLPNLLDMPDSIGRLTVYGPTLQPLELAAMLAMVLPFALLGAIDARTPRERTLYLISTGLLLAGGVATARKTSLVVPGLVILLLVAYRPRAMIRLLLTYGIVLVALVHFASPSALGTVISQLQPGHVNTVLTTTDRTARYDAVTPDVLRRPLLGRGYESYDPQKYRILDNQYLDLVITVGLIGVLAYLAIFGAIMSAARRTIRGPDPRRASLALAAFVSVAALAVASALFDVLSFPHVPYLLFFVAAMITALREHSPTPEPEPIRLPAPSPRPLGNIGPSALPVPPYIPVETPVSSSPARVRELEPVA